MRKLRPDYEKTGFSSCRTHPEFPVDEGGPFYITYSRNGQEYEFFFEDLKDREAREVVNNCLSTNTDFKVIAFWPGKKSKGHVFKINNEWLAKKLGLKVKV